LVCKNYQKGGVARPKHPDKDLEAVLRSLESAGWRIEKSRKYFKGYCPCGNHKKTVPLTPSDPDYRRHLVGRLWRET
jgi:hypothetical protein